MGRKILVHYKPEGSSIREFETSVSKLLCLATITVVSASYTLISLGTYLLQFSEQTSTITASVASPSGAYTPKIKPSSSVVNSAKQSDKLAIKQEKIATIVRPDLQVPERQINSLGFEKIKTEEDESNLYVSYNIVNKNATYAKGYTYGVAIFKDATGNETIVTSHPGITSEKPFSTQRFVAGNSYGAKRYTSKSVNFQKPEVDGKFTKAWIVASRGHKLTYETWVFESQ